jgi:hypothetical protein
MARKQCFLVCPPLENMTRKRYFSNNSLACPELVYGFCLNLLLILFSGI